MKNKLMALALGLPKKKDDVPAELRRRIKRFSATLKVPAALFRLSKDGAVQIVSANRRLAEWLNLDVDTLIASPELFWLGISDESKAQLGEMLTHCNRQPETVCFRFRLHPPGGESRWVEVKAIPEIDDQKDVSLWSVLFFDLTERKSIHVSLIEQAMRLRSFVDQAQDGIVVLNRDMAVVDVNAAFAEMLGYSIKEMLKMHVWDWDFEFSQGELRELGASEAFGVLKNFETVHHRKDGSSVPVEVVSTKSTWGGVDYSFCVVRDITSRKRIENALRQREQEFRSLVENSPDIITRYDRNFRRIYGNPAANALSGFSIGSVVDRDSANNDYLVDANILRQAIQIVFMTGKAETREFDYYRPNGDLATALARFEPEFDELGNVQTVLGVGRDITELVHHRSAVEQLANHDALTGLPNRAHLNRQVQAAIDASRVSGNPFFLMLLDLDEFKDVNDSLGHSAGDSLLKEAARRLHEVVGSQDFCARLGGDEFSILITSLRRDEDATAIAQRVLGAMARPFRVDGHDVSVSGSLGVARYPDHADDIDKLFACADAAMYEAKRRGRNNFQMFEDAHIDSAMERVSIRTALRRAIADDQLEMWLQPRVNLESGEIVGAEALLRWRHPEKGILVPGQFIEVAEHSGLILDLNAWVLTRACTFISQVNAHRADPLSVSVNLSGRLFRKGDLRTIVQGALKDANCDKAWLDVEINERLLLNSVDQAADVVEELSRLGLSITVDNFGKTFASLNCLALVNATRVKVSGDLVRMAQCESRRMEIMKGIVSTANAIGLDTIAECVETEEQAAAAAHCGCLEAQGLLYGGPMQEADFLHRLAQQNQALNCDSETA